MVVYSFYLDGWMDLWMDRRIDGSIFVLFGWMDGGGWMDGRIDGSIFG